MLDFITNNVLGVGGAQAAAALQEALQLRGPTGLPQSVGTLGSLAEAFRTLGRYDEALRMLEIAQGVPSLPTAARRLLQAMSSQVHDCSGSAPLALHEFEKSLRIEPPTTPEDSQSLTLQHVSLLRRARATPGIPTKVSEAMAERERQHLGRLLREGPWEREEQLPRRYIPGLKASPWHQVEDFPPTPLGWAITIIESAVPQLREVKGGRPIHVTLSGCLTPLHVVCIPPHVFILEEYISLRQAGKLEENTECIISPDGSQEGDRGGGDSREGPTTSLDSLPRWRSYEATGYWNDLDPRGCSKDSPVLCRLRADLEELSPGLVIRLGYSALDPHTRLAPHHGMTNGQLKLHTGLILPYTEGEGPCATMRVGNETRAWVEGKSLFFDDSYEHEVWNRCAKERVVAQVVLVHPGLLEKLAREAAAGAAFAKGASH